MKWWRRLLRRFKEKPAVATFEINFEEAIVEADGPLFNVGDYVQIVNPNTGTAWAGDSDFADLKAEIYRVSEIRYIEATDAYVYRLNEDTRWYNENWLQLDRYGDLTVEPDQIEKEAQGMFTFGEFKPPTPPAKSKHRDQEKAEVKRRKEYRAKTDELLDEYNRLNAVGDKAGANRVLAEMSVRANIHEAGGGKLIADIFQKLTKQDLITNSTTKRFSRQILCSKEGEKMDSRLQEIKENAVTTKLHDFFTEIPYEDFVWLVQQAEILYWLKNSLIERYNEGMVTKEEISKLLKKLNA